MDASGQVIGFTARIITSDPDAPKYLNTPQTLLYDKGRHVFGLSQAKEAVRTNDYAVIVEGNLDVVSSHQADIKGVVATAGTAITESHLRALRRLTGNIRLAFDGDRAGIAATERAIPIASDLGVELTIIRLPDGYKDPDELIQHDSALWQTAIDSAEPAVDWVLGQYGAREDITMASGKRAFTTAALAIVRSLGDAVEREHYEKKIAHMIGSTLEAVRAKSASVATTVPPAMKRPAAASYTTALDPYMYQDNVLAVALIDAPSQELLLHADTTMFVGEHRQAVAAYIAKHAGQSIAMTPNDLQIFDTYVKILLLKADARYKEWDDKDRYFETARLLRQVINEHKKQTREQLTHELRDAENRDDDDTATRLRTQLNTLIKEISHGQR
jgi:DNA primase